MWRCDQKCKILPTNNKFSDYGHLYDHHDLIRIDLLQFKAINSFAADTELFS